jgi:hypothetical protein
VEGSHNMKNRETLEQSKVTSNRLREMAGDYDNAKTEEDKVKITPPIKSYLFYR